MPVTIRHTPTAAVLAQADPANGSVLQYEGYWYFTPETVDETQLRITSRTYTCPYKGTCYWVDHVDPTGRTTPDVAWIYPEPKRGHEPIKGRYGFYPGSRPATTAEIDESRP